MILEAIKGFDSDKYLKHAQLLVLVILVMIGSLLSGSFLSVGNITNIMRQVSINGILAVGVTYAVLGGGFDLSVGSLVSLCAITALYLQTLGVPAWVTIIVSLMIGLASGSVTGKILGTMRSTVGNTFVVTLGMQIFLQAIALIVSRGRSMPGSKSDLYNYAGQAKVLGVIPVALVIFLLIAAIGHFVLVKTEFGKSVQFVGANIDAAELCGIKIKRIKMATFMITGVCAGIAAVILSGRIWGAIPDMGVRLEFDAVMAVTVGSPSLRGNVIRTVIGVFIIGVFTNILALMGVSIAGQMIARGVIVVTAVLIGTKR